MSLSTSAQSYPVNGHVGGVQPKFPRSVNSINSTRVFDEFHEEMSYVLPKTTLAHPMDAHRTPHNTPTPNPAGERGVSDQIRCERHQHEASRPQTGLIPSESSTARRKGRHRRPLIHDPPNGSTALLSSQYPAGHGSVEAVAPVSTLPSPAHCTARPASVPAKAEQQITPWYHDIKPISIAEAMSSMPDPWSKPDGYDVWENVKKRWLADQQRGLHRALKNLRAENGGLREDVSILLRQNSTRYAQLQFLHNQLNERVNPPNGIHPFPRGSTSLQHQASISYRDRITEPKAVAKEDPAKLSPDDLSDNESFYMCSDSE